MRVKYNLTALVFGIAVLLVVAFSWSDHIIFTDEVLFEEASYQMRKTGDLLTPRLEGKVWLEKPPLYFWVTAAIYRVFPQTPFTRRIPTLLAAIGTLFLTFRLAQALFSRKVAHFALIILTTTPLFLFFTKTANLDIPQTFLTTATLFLYLKSKINPKWLLIAGLTTGLGLLTRSFLAALPVLVIAVDQVLEKEKRIPTLYCFFAMLVALGIALPWHLAVWRQYPELFVRDYFKFNIEKHLFSQTPGYPPLSAPKFLINSLVKYAPGNLLALGLLLPKPKPLPRITFLITWFLTIIVSLTLATTRHEWYAIQALPPLAILSGAGLIQVERLLKLRIPQPRWGTLKIFAMAIFLALPIAVFAGLKKEVKSVILLKRFISSTPPDVPLFNLEHLYVPQSTLYNPRETPVISQTELGKLQIPIYLYLNSREQYESAQQVLGRCCHEDVFAEDERGALILRLSPKQP